MKTETIRFSKIFKASPLQVYHLLLDKDQHALITGSEVKISNKTDGKFVVWGGYCYGYNIQLIEGEKIVQAWHFDEDQWPDNHYSICTFNFEPCSEGCLMHFEQSEVPEASCESLKKGWQEYYWTKMDEVLARR